MPNPDGRPRLCLDDEAIVVAYHDGLSESAIARQFGIGRTTVHRRLADAGVTFRSAVEARALTCHKTFELTEEVLELIDGVLLGDGYCSPNKKSESRLTLSQRHDRVDWQEALVEAFAQHGVTSKITPRNGRTTKINGRIVRGRPTNTWRTLKYATFSQQRKRWYPEGEKRVPVDVRLTPTALAHWYWGDGTTESRGYAMGFCTESFTDDGVHLLAERLTDLYGWKVNFVKHGGGLRLQINRREHRADLLHIIEDACPASFDYKLQPLRRRLND